MNLINKQTPILTKAGYNSVQQDSNGKDFIIEKFYDNESCSHNYMVQN